MTLFRKSFLGAIKEVIVTTIFFDLSHFNSVYGRPIVLPLKINVNTIEHYSSIKVSLVSLV